MSAVPRPTVKDESHKDVRQTMRARAGDPPRTMPQKVLAGRTSDTQLKGDMVRVKVDQVILSLSLIHI